MNSFIQNPFIIASVSFFLSVLLTYLVREFARKKGIVAKPKSDRWHKKPTAMLGGLAIFLTTVIIALLFVPHSTGTVGDTRRQFIYVFDRFD